MTKRRHWRPSHIEKTAAFFLCCVTLPVVLWNTGYYSSTTTRAACHSGSSSWGSSEACEAAQRRGLLNTSNNLVDCDDNPDRCNNSSSILPSNPFDTGCLYNLLPEWRKKRVCNSEDPPEAASRGICHRPDIEYQEIRIIAREWQSAILLSFLLQVILSELLNVPATIETGSPHAILNFYDPQARLDTNFSNLVLEEALDNAVKYNMDCRLATQKEHYKPCAHVVPEVWKPENPWMVERVKRGMVKPPQSMGVLGKDSWHVPKFTGQYNASLLSYLGLQGEHNRHTLAETFLRPTMWKDYCQSVSPSNCELPDNVTERPPHNESEGSRFFVESLYKGHFRPTDQNNCTMYPDNCTGHFAGYDCTWPGYVEARTHHLGIALEWSGPPPSNTGGYSPLQLQEIWKAANATRSHLIMTWWSPDALFQSFQGTDAEFVQVGLPSPTQECLDHRIKVFDQCSSNFGSRVGDPRGVCDDPPRPLRKLVLADLDENLQTPVIPKAIQSPAYAALDLFSISELQVSKILGQWLVAAPPRQSVCQWIVDNFDLVENWIPPTYPRVLEEEKLQGLTFAIVLLGVVSMVLVASTGFWVFKERRRQVMRYAQVEFLLVILVGLFLISSGAVVVGIPPTDTSCVVEVWLINIGYTLELVPVLLKVAAINRLWHTTHRIRRLKLQVRSLFGAVLLVVGLVALFLTVWTALDAPARQQKFDLTDDTTPDGDTTITVGCHCSSERDFWNFAGLGWNAILILSASVLAFQTRNLHLHFNETGQLSSLIYSHAVCFVFRVVSYVPSSVMTATELAIFRSAVFSVDTMGTIVIYFVPKFLVGINDHVWPDHPSTDLSATNTTTRFPAAENPDPSLPGLNGASDSSTSPQRSAASQATVRWVSDNPAPLEPNQPEQPPGRACAPSGSSSSQTRRSATEEEREEEQDRLADGDILEANSLLSAFDATVQDLRSSIAERDGATVDVHRVARLKEEFSALLESLVDQQASAGSE